MSWCCGSENEKRIKRRRENNQNSKRQDNKYYIKFCANPNDLKAQPIYTWISNDFFDNKDQQSFYGQPMHVKNNKNGQNRPKQVQVNYNANNAQKAFSDNLRPKNFAEQYKNYPFMYNIFQAEYYNPLWYNHNNQTTTINNNLDIGKY
jgi:hypothetical protein